MVNVSFCRLGRIVPAPFAGYVLPYVRSDIARLDDICRELLFGRLDFDTWLDLYSEIDRDYSGEFMPAAGKARAVC